MPQQLDPDFLAAARQTTGSRASGALYDHAIFDPDKEAENRKIARQIGSAPAIVRGAPEEARLAAKRFLLSGQQERLQSAPNAAAWLAKGDNAGVAQDDVGVLSKIGTALLGTASRLPFVAPVAIGAAAGYGAVANPRRAAEVIRKSPAAAGAGLAGVASGVAGLAEGAAELQDTYSPVAWAERKLFGGTVEGGIADLARRRREQWSRVADAVRPTSDSKVVTDILGGVESVPGSIAALGVTLATGNPLAGAASLGAVTGGQSYGEARDAGLTPLGAATKAGIDAVIETGTEIGPERAFGKITGATPLGTVLKEFALKELLGEEAATATQDLNQFLWIDHPDGKTWGDYASEIVPHAVSTAISTITMAGAASALPVTLRAFDRRSGRNQLPQLKGRPSQ